MKLAVRVALAIVALAACSKASPPPAPQAAPAAARDASDPSCGAPLTVAAGQVVTATVADWDTTDAELRLWKRDGGWKLVRSWPGVVGANGTAWGIGLHGAGAPADPAQPRVKRGGPVKREGDGKSPAGVFAIRSAYGYADAKTALPYRTVDPAWKCVDDSKSAHYTKIVDERGVQKDWTSAEDMRRGDDLYKYVVDVAHNSAATPGGGSCIFLHVWSGPDSSTAGCTAMGERELATLLRELDPSALFVLLPRAEYDALAPVWDLPR